jgi:hypothetical protein
MARGKQLIQLIDDLRAEIGHSQNAALGQNFVAGLKSVLRRQQEALYGEHDWEHLKCYRNIDMQAGQREYNFPADIDPDRVLKAWFRSSSAARWVKVPYGITQEHYDASDSDDPNVRQDFVRRWQQNELGQVEVWPRPATNTGQLRFRALRRLRPLIADADTADLDDILIVLHSAAEFLAKQKSADAQLKLQKAQARFKTVKANAPDAKNEPFVMGGGCDPTEGEHEYRSDLNRFFVR